MNFIKFEDDYDDFYKSISLESRALWMINNNVVTENSSVDNVKNMIQSMLEEKKIKDEISDSNIKYNDEITEINYIGELETIDIGVTGDSLFYCNNILTKNSYSTNMTADSVFGIIQTPELFDLNKYIIKVLKSRFMDNINSCYTIGVDRSKMRLLNLSEDDQELPINIKDKIKVEQHHNEQIENEKIFDFSN